MILLVQNKEDYNNDLRAMIMAFFPGEKITGMTPVQVTELSKELHREFRFILTALFDEKRTLLKLEQKGAVQFSAYVDGDYENKKRFRNRLKLGSYRLLSEFTGRTLPWGCLTGVRPSKIAMAGLNQGKSKDEMIQEYQRIYDTSPEKARLATRVAAHEKELLADIDQDRDYCLYVGIPFCPSRCLYCSFTSYPIAVYKDKVKAYLDTLEQELQYISYAYRDRNLISVYIGGGTPTSLDHQELEVLLSYIARYFDFSNVREYTVEAGRPDSITEEKLMIMKKMGVTRISINPQTMNDQTLRTIGRAHTAEQAKIAFRMARKAGFDNINMDLIAGLPGEDKASMQHTLEEIRSLGPDSLTVHSLAIKRAANLKQQMAEYGATINKDMDAMLNLVARTAAQAGMEPYYMYRQKNIGGNLENVGYSTKGKECLYNILIMEEITDIIAAGAGASTKLTFHAENRVERVENCKSVDDYINRFDEMLERKTAAGIR
jgi:oxygen-independent coproporphyrinogen-3 oxidase